MSSVGRMSSAPRTHRGIDLEPLLVDGEHGVAIDRLTNDEAGLFELVDQLRRIRALTTGGLFDIDLHPITERVRAVADELEAASASPERRQAVTWAAGDYVANCPIIGRGNLVAPPVEFELLPNGVMRGETTLGLEYQGPPGCVHGGVIALLFDVLLGRVNHHIGATGMTVSLEIDYLAAVPIREPLSISGRQVRVEGRKIWSQGAIHRGDTLCATAEGLFVTPRELLVENKRRILAEGAEGAEG